MVTLIKCLWYLHLCNVLIGETKVQFWNNALYILDRPCVLVLQSIRIQTFSACASGRPDPCGVQSMHVHAYLTRPPPPPEKKETLYSSISVWYTQSKRLWCGAWGTNTPPPLPSPSSIFHLSLAHRDQETLVALSSLFPVDDG